MKKIIGVALLGLLAGLIAYRASALPPVHEIELSAVPQAGSTGHQVALTCTPGAVDATHDAATSFNFKRGTVTGGPYTTIGNAPTCSFIDTAVSAGQKFFYVSTGVNAGGESGPSNEVSAVIPSFPPNSPSVLAGTPK